jgi:hypothetical protein
MIESPVLLVRERIMNLRVNFGVSSPSGSVSIFSGDLGGFAAFQMLLTAVSQ